MGVQELLIVFAILLLFFGAKKLPGLASSLGTSMKEFRKAAETEGDDDTDAEATSDDPTDSGGEARPVDREAER